ncbi:hypothetical protein MSKOL_0496 [Methanosarcina sp. Kolksee]|uniref:hypothetical protein n=1 Tax=Methanosarcina sp. Kolksee TaxID=1434099 RepID=UPI0006160DDC|nr:hypothetical protein [Methanosarcina sp. Kolksee]AKB46273.1 hypothetical protein MSKOL_0496 [Methanosarcina sp. Kolksee]
MKKQNENRHQSEKKLFLHTESATATAIGAVLLLGIIFLVLSMIRIYYVPEWKNDDEYSHMDDVRKDMAEIKSKIDIMSIILASTPNSSNINSSNPSSSTSHIIMSVPFHMGSGGTPLVSSMKSSGTLAVNKDKCKMELKVNYDKDDPYVKSINCGTITYNSHNNYYMDQVFSYENGALILKQNEQSTMMLYPSIRFSKASKNEYNVSINAIRIFQKLYVPPEVISSDTECSLRLIGIDYIPLYDSEKDTSKSVSRFYLTITTNHPEAWRIYLRKVIQDAGIDPDSGNYVQNLSSSTEYKIGLTFPLESDTSKGTDKTISDSTLNRIYLSETVVKAEPGIGLN